MLFPCKWLGKIDHISPIYPWAIRPIFPFGPSHTTPSTVRKECASDVSISVFHGKENVEIVSQMYGNLVVAQKIKMATASKGIHWMQDLFPAFGAVPFFALLVRHKAGAETYRHLSMIWEWSLCEMKLEYYQVNLFTIDKYSFSSTFKRSRTNHWQKPRYEATPTLIPGPMWGLRTFHALRCWNSGADRGGNRRLCRNLLTLVTTPVVTTKERKDIEDAH